MITIRKLDIFYKYMGVDDSFNLRRITENDREVNREEWRLIESLTQDAILIEKGLASESFKLSFLERLKAACDNVQTEKKLCEIALEINDYFSKHRFK
jgi:hypothetical protein